ncbi:hypothetical protein [Calothrix sp. NIES-2098]
MFKQLSLQKNNTFKLEVENPQQRQLLNSTYMHLLTGDSWPPGTKNITEWTFNCCVQTEELDNYTACQFTYYDYAGGRLTDVDEDSDFEKVVKQADVILGLLDGHKIHAWLTGGSNSLINTFLTMDLPSILKRMQNCTVPVHFVISKWDILDKNYSLNQVYTQLCTIPEFAQLLATRSNVASPVRLIPVSSVGLDFATLQSDGSMKKNPGRIPSPFLVEVPIACVLPDRLKQLINETQIKQKQLEAQNQKADTGNNILIDVLIGSLDLLGFGLNSFDLLLEFADGEEIKAFKFVTKAASLTNGLLKKGIIGVTDKIGKQARNKREQTLNAVKDEQSALRHAISVFRDFESELTELFPQSRLV